MRYGLWALLLSAACTSSPTPRVTPSPSPSPSPPDPVSALITASDLGEGWAVDEETPADPVLTVCPGHPVEAELAASRALLGDEAVDFSYVEHQVFRVADPAAFRERVRQAAEACATYRLDHQTECTASYTVEDDLPVVRYWCGFTDVAGAGAVLVVVADRGLASVVSYSVGEGYVGPDQHTRMADLARRRLRR